MTGKGWRGGGRRDCRLHSGQMEAQFVGVIILNHHLEQHRREDVDRASELSPATPADVVPPKPHGLVALRRCSGRTRPPQPHGGSGVQEQKSERQISRRRGAARLPARARAALSARDCAPLRIRGCSLSHPIARAGSRRFNLKGICADLEDMRRYRQTMAAWILCPRRRHGA